GLNEAYRILKPGGRFFCMEFSKVENFPIFDELYKFYSKQIIPVMGEIIAGDFASYDYLIKSIEKFPDQVQFGAMIENAGFEDVDYENVLFGAIAIHSGVFLKISKLIGNLNAQKIISWKIYSQSFFSCKVFSLTDIGEGIHEVALKKWFIKEGDKIEQFQDICEVQSDKSSVVITSRYDGIISKVHHDVDSIIKVGDSLVSIETDDLLLDNVTNSTFEDTESNMKKDNTNSIHNMSNDSVNKSHSKNNKKIMTTPAIRRMASEHDIDLSIIKGTGPNNRIIKEDMLLYLAENKTYENHEKSKSQEQLYLDSDTDSLCNSEIKLNMFQRSMCKNMQKSILVPQFGLCDIVEMDEMISLRRIFNKNDEQITFMPIFIKACSFALKEFPIFNGVFDSENLSIQLN
ncbi:Lipoamide acyltransferase, mitochondrial, partial [Intoshia linei]